MHRLYSFIEKRKRFVMFSLLKMLIMLLGLVTNIIIVRKLTVYDYGVFSVAFMLIGLFTTFGFSWSSSSILYYGSKEKAKYGTINKTIWARNIIIFFSLVVVTVLFVIFNTAINEYVGEELAFLMLIWLYISVFEDYLSMYFLAVKKQILSSMLSITAKLIYLVLILLISFDIKSLLVMNIVSHATVLLYILGINKKDLGSFEFDKKWFKEVLNFSIWQLFGFSGLYLINFGDTAVIKYYMTTEDVGIYNGAYKLFNNIASFSYVISSYYASNITRYFENNDYKKIHKFFFRERFIIIGLSLIAHIIVIVFSKPIIIALYGERYIASVPIFNTLMIGSIFRYLSVFHMMYFNTNGKHKRLQVINISRAIINLGLDIIFIKYFGLIGPAIATVIAIILTTLYSTLYCEKRIRKLSTTE